ncbi:MAG: hypothetical protein ACM30G_11135, partial [Micromonosporaceae bacterium]
SKPELLARLRELRRDADRSDRPAKAGSGRSRRGPARATDRPATPAAPAIGTAAALGELPGPTLESSMDRFWVAPVPLPARPPTLQHGADLLLRQLPAPAPVLGGPALTEQLSLVYERFGTTRDGGDSADPVGRGRREGGRGSRRSAAPTRI